jgi:hypothetical protein
MSKRAKPAMVSNDGFTGHVNAILVWEAKKNTVHSRWVHVDVDMGPRHAATFVLPDEKSQSRTVSLGWHAGCTFRDPEVGKELGKERVLYAKIKNDRLNPEGKEIPLPMVVWGSKGHEIDMFEIECTECPTNVVDFSKAL